MLKQQQQKAFAIAYFTQLWQKKEGKLLVLKGAEEKAYLPIYNTCFKVFLF